MPNTALEPTAFTPVRLRFGRRLADDFRRRGSAFGRSAQAPADLMARFFDHGFRGWPG